MNESLIWIIVQLIFIGLPVFFISKRKMKKRNRKRIYIKAAFYGLLSAFSVPILIEISLVCIFIFLANCCWGTDPPTDDEMIQHFYAHESAFNQIKEELSSMRTDVSHYPPYYPDDTTCLAGMSISTQKALDSLLVEIGCERIIYSIKAGGQDYEKEMPDVGLSISYFGTGSALGGTSKDFVYSTKVGRRFEIIEDRELNDVYQEQYKDTIIYKSIKGNWYIRLIHDN